MAIVTSCRQNTRFVPIPARLLLRSWVRSDVPRIDRWLRPAQVLHATNYLAPPSHLPTIVSVYDCSFVRYPELCTPEVRAFEPIIRRAIARGATVHTGSEFVAGEIEDIFGNGLRADGRLVVIPLGIPSIGATGKMPAAVGAQLDGVPYVFAIGTLEPRKNFPTSSRRSVSWPRTTPTCGSSSRATTGPRDRPSTMRSPRSIRPRGPA